MSHSQAKETSRTGSWLCRHYRYLDVSGALSLSQQHAPIRQTHFISTVTSEGSRTGKARIAMWQGERQQILFSGWASSGSLQGASCDPESRNGRSGLSAASETRTEGLSLHLVPGTCSPGPTHHQTKQASPRCQLSRSCSPILQLHELTQAGSLGDWYKSRKSWVKTEIETNFHPDTPCHSPLWCNIELFSICILDKNVTPVKKNKNYAFPPPVPLSLSPES